MALVLFFSSYFQYWWDGAANFFNPFFPWIVLAPLWAIPFAVRLLMVFWLLVCGLLAYFYPPNAIALGFVGGADLAGRADRLAGVAQGAGARRHGRRRRRDGALLPA